MFPHIILVSVKYSRKTKKEPRPASRNMPWWFMNRSMQGFEISSQNKQTNEKYEI